MNAPRENLIRNIPFEITRAESDGDGLNLEGYAAVFDSPTVINSWEGKFQETIDRGAFSKSISERTPVLMFNHGQHPLIGDMPIGVITHISEDNRGLKVRARLASNWLIAPVREAIEQKAVTGMSFRMSVIKDVWERPKGRDDIQSRRIREVSCPELGPVVFPAYDETSVGVRSQALLAALSDPDTRTEFAQALYAEAPERAATKDPYGDVAYADPGYKDDKQKRYPINTAQHVKTAWSYINMPKNQADYTSEQLASIKGRIKTAAKKFGITIGDDSMKSGAPSGDSAIRDLNGWLIGDVAPIVEDAIEDQFYEGESVYLSDFSDSLAYYSVWADGEMELYEISYLIDDSGAVTLGTPVEVLKKTTYVPATSDEAADGTSEEAGRSADEPGDVLHSTDIPQIDAETRRLDRLLKARDLGV